MNTMTPGAARFLRRLAVAGAAVAGALLVPALASAVQQPIPSPAVPGAPALPGAIVSAGTPAANMTILTASPDTATAGTSIAFTATGLPANQPVNLVWMTASVSYVLDPKPDSVDYIGRKVTQIATLLATGKTDASGKLAIATPMPTDFGGLHDVYAVINGQQVAKGGVLLSREVTIAPTKGPIGTRIAVHVVGMGSPTYESVGAILWDNHYAGAIAANMTRGVADFVIRASGPVGQHWLEVAGSSHTVPYLNMKQSPVPWTDAHRLEFTVTGDSARLPLRTDDPLNLTPTISSRTTISDSTFGSQNAAGVTATADSSMGTILSKVNVTASGLQAGQPVSVQWATVVGNRVNCTGTCWQFVYQPLGTATAGADGSLKTSVTIPDNLGGWHAIQLIQGQTTMAQIPYFVKRMVVDYPKVVKAGQPFEVHLKGMGWTQLDNTVAVDYDNSYMGYGCGFNSNGDTVLQLFATGGPGTHLIDLYPLLYTQQPAYPYPQLGMVPFLSYKTEFPGLAAGYQIPAFRLAIKVV